MEGVLSEAQQTKISESFEKFFVTICSHGSLSDWPVNLISIFHLSQDERFHLAQKIIEASDRSSSVVARHITQFNLSPEQQRQLAFAIVDKGQSLSFYIDTFAIDDEATKAALAHKEMDNAGGCPECVSLNIKKYSIHDQQKLVDLAKKAAQTKSFDLTNLPNYGIEDENVRYEIFATCAKTKGEKVLPHMQSAQLTLEHRIAIAKEMGEHSSTGNIIESWAHFDFDPETTAQLLFHLASTNPVIIYENWGTLPLISDEDKERLKGHIPFFTFEQIIESCDKKMASVPPPTFATLKEELTPLLHSLHELNKKSAIPFNLYSTEKEWQKINLSHLVRKIALLCQPEELLSLVTLLQENYFCGTNPFLFQIYLIAKQDYSTLGEFITRFGMNEASSIFTPFITAKEAGAIVQAKLKKLNLEHNVLHPPVFHLDQLEEQIRNFQASSQQKALFLVNFDKENLQGHYSPLILEKKDGVIRILNSDSIYSGGQKFTPKIVEKLKQLPFKTEIYIVPEARQHDFFSCPVFSIGDIKEAAKTMSQEGISFFDYFKEHAQPLSDGVREVRSLPVGMMKMSQSLSKIRTLARESPTFLKKGSPTSLEEYVADRTYVSYAPEQRIHRKVNMATAIKAAKYFQKRLEQVIRDSKSSIPHSQNPHQD